MAERRMFAKAVVLSDAFLDMPHSTKSLYYTIGMLADDDGFINSTKSIIRQCGATANDYNTLLSNGFLIAFPNGVVAIKHWKVNNYLRNDRYRPTTHTAEKACLTLDENGWYTMRETNGIHRLGQDRLGQDRLGQVSVSAPVQTHGHTQEPLQETTRGEREAPIPHAAEAGEKLAYGTYQNVLLTEAEYKALAEEYPDLNIYIDRLSHGIKKHGYRYKSHLLALRDWIADAQKQETSPEATCASSFETDAFWQLALAHSYGTSKQAEPPLKA